MAEAKCDASCNVIFIHPVDLQSSSQQYERYLKSTKCDLHLKAQRKILEGIVVLVSKNESKRRKKERRKKERRKRIQNAGKECK